MEYENIKNRIQELSTYTSNDNRTVRKLCVFKGKKIIQYEELYAVENVLNELEKCKYKLTLISETCIDESKSHIKTKDAIKKIVNILQR